MLLAYLNEPEITLEALMQEVDQHLRFIKEQAESLAYRGQVDEIFQYAIAQLCLYITQFKEHLQQASLCVERFIENSLQKLHTYFELYQDLQRLVTLFTKGSMEALTRLPKIEQTSSFNVIKINLHTIEIHCHNQALVIPNTQQQQQQQQVQKQQTSIIQLLQIEENRNTILTKVREVKERFEQTQSRMRVYQRHYIELDKRTKLEVESGILFERLEEFIQDTRFIKQIERIRTLFKEVLQILRLEYEHCRDYVNNAVSRFIECFTLYERLEESLRIYEIEETVVSIKKEETAEVKRGCASMY